MPWLLTKNGFQESLVGTSREARQWLEAEATDIGYSPREVGRAMWCPASQNFPCSCSVPAEKGRPGKGHMQRPSVLPGSALHPTLETWPFVPEGDKTRGDFILPVTRSSLHLGTDKRRQISI